jgi:phosphoglycolate phosphatase-like HAD superfamily hydrolase
VLLGLVPSLADDGELLRVMLKRLGELTRENLQLISPLPLAMKIPRLASCYRLGAATNRKSSARLVLAQLGIEKYFSVVMTSADAPHKPSPKMIEMCLEGLRVKAGEAVFVGDNEEDRLAGEAAGVRMLMVDGYDSVSAESALKEFLP